MEFLTNLILTLVSLGAVAGHTVAAVKHFDVSDMQPGAKVIAAMVVLTTIFFVFQTWSAVRPLTIEWLGILLELVSLWLFISAIRASRTTGLKAAFSRTNPHALVRTGPYRYIRHPFYTSYNLFWIGWAIAIFNVWVVVPAIVLVALYVIAARGEERKFAGTDMAEDYADYKASTGFMWPRLTRR